MRANGSHSRKNRNLRLRRSSRVAGRSSFTVLSDRLRGIVSRLKGRLPSLAFAPSASSKFGRHVSRWNGLTGRAAHLAKARLPRVPTAYDLVAFIHPSLRGVLIASLSVTAFLLLGYVFVFSTKGLISRQKFGALIEARRAENDELRRANADLKLYIARLENDTETIEGFARNELNMVMPEESVYRVTPDGPPAYVLNVPSTPPKVSGASPSATRSH
jgi:cell division protein FtsB